ncbi:MAG: hypothetical protein KDA85_17910 [Planctomycetaceae bacterium]|nr:hypothetical protein [Planctomycetaceae bacterium]
MSVTNDPQGSSIPDDEWEPDPVFVSGRREAKWILLMWASCFAWTILVCGRIGYLDPTGDPINPETMPLVLGLPRWVFWGIAFPWLIANVVSIWFCLGYMKDADLGEDAAEAGFQHDSGSPPQTNGQGVNA